MIIICSRLVELEHKSNGWGLSSFSQSPVPLSTLSSFISLITTTSLCRALLCIASAEAVCGGVSGHEVSSETIFGVEIYKSARDYSVDCANSVLFWI